MNDIAFEKKEAGADSVEVLGQNELAGVDWVIWTTDRLVERLRESGCLHFDSSLNLEAIRALISGHIAGDLDRLRDYQPAISVSDGGGSDASRASSPNSVPANAQGPMEGEDLAREICEYFRPGSPLCAGDVHITGA